MQDRLTDVLAAGAVVSPWWLPGLKDISEFVALFLPILGAIWLIVQIWAKIKITFFTTRKTDEKEG